MAHRLRINSSLVTLMVVALLGALLLPPNWGGWIRGPASYAFWPVSASVRALARAVNLKVATPRRTVSEERQAPKNDEQLRAAYEKLQNELETLKSQYVLLQSQNEELQQRLNERKNWPAELLKQSKVVEVASGDAGNRQMLTLRPGGLENPTNDAAVLVGTDIVGKLKIVGLGVVKVLLITDRDSVVSGEFTHYHPDGSGIERVQAPLCAARGDGAGGLLIKGYKLTDLQGPDKKRKVVPGDRLVLHDSEWPSAVQSFCIGEIEEIRPDSRNLFCDIRIRPRRDLMKLRDVMVLRR
jgi:cell shape-determining protein MreC